MTLIEKRPKPRVDDPIEVLIREARQRSRRRRATLSALATGLAVVVLVVVASVVWGRANSGPNVANKPVSSAAAALPPCRAAQLAVTDVAGNGAALTFPWIIHYKNISSSSCALTGYPTVVGTDKWTRRLFAATHTLNSYTGGWMGYRANAQPKPVPTVALRARTGVASSMIVALVNDNWRVCHVFTSIRVTVPGSTTPFVLTSLIEDCKYFQAHPIVPGTTGRAY